jgi:adenylate kinase
MMIEAGIFRESDRDVHDLGTMNTQQRLSTAAIIFLGPPGAGKGTQARHAAAKYNLPHISTGDTFRAHIEKKTTLGLQAAESMCRGMLVPDALVCRMLREHILGIRFAGSLILDGFPRSLAQAKWLDYFLHVRSCGSHDLPGKAPVAIQIHIDRDQLLRRLAGRRSCPTCGRTYNLHLQPPMNSGICDYEGAELVMRPDDSEKVICERLIVHDKHALLITKYYRSKGRLVEIDGNGTVTAVRTAITAELESVFAFATK